MVKDLFVILDDFILFYFVEPDKKVYYIADTDKIICSQNRLTSQKFVSRFQAQTKVDSLKKKFNIDFCIERL